MATRADDGMKLVRADLVERLDALELRLARRGIVGGAEQASEIAMIAAEYGLRPVQRLAEGLAVALGTGGRGAAIGPWMEQLRAAIDCQSQNDEAAGTSWLASVLNRLAG